MAAGFVVHSLIGFFLLHVIAWAFSENRRIVAWRPVVAGMLLTLGLGILLLKVPLFKEIFFLLNDALNALERATREGTSFVFGFLGGGPLPFPETYPGASFVLAFRALPLVLVVSALSALLFHWRVLPWIVRMFSLLLQKTMGVGGAIGLSSAANVFVGMVEAPLIVKPYIRNMSRSELFILMSCGMATVAGTVMALYASILSKVVPDALGHILIASIISTPAAIAVSVLMVPGEAVATEGKLVPQAATSSMDAVARGTVDGAQLLVNIVAMLVVLVALVSLANQILALLPEVAGAPVTLQRVLSPRSRLMMTYALCGFANFGSLGIMIGGLATLAPERRDEIVSLGGKTIVSGTLATCVAGSVVGVLY